ncbi:MAG TPA: hypothetical protein VIL17_07940, partial [Coriobacteriia bacterium]
EFLGDQQREGGDARMTLTLFDTHLTPLAAAVPIREIAPLDVSTFEPGGMTALYDAIGHTMTMADDFYAEHKPDQVLFVIMTDGEENSSREFDRDRIFGLIEERQRSAGYEFIYLGANQDSYLVGQAMGIRAGRMVDWSATPEETAATMQRVSRNVRAHRRYAEAQSPVMFSPEFEAMADLEGQELADAKMAYVREAKRG